jgi:hypothetical protein
VSIGVESDPAAMVERHGAETTAEVTRAADLV